MWKRLVRYLILIILVVSPIAWITPWPSSAWDLSATSVNITITVSPLAAPEVTNGTGASSVGSTSARLNGEVTEDGNEYPDVTVFWGESDGGTNPSSWSNNSSLGALSEGTFYYDATGLTPEVLHYYRMYAKNSGGSDWADSTANFTTIAQLDPPSGLTLTDLGAITVQADWTKGAGANYTMLRASREDYPENTDDGELLYYGQASSYNITGMALDITEYFVSGFSFDSDNTTYASGYDTASIGGDSMGEIADSLNTLSGMGWIAINAFLLIGLLALALWKRDMLWFMASGLVALFIGLSWIDANTGVAMAIIGIGTFQLLEALILAVASGGAGKGWSQFKGIYNNIKEWF